MRPYSMFGIMALFTCSACADVDPGTNITHTTVSSPNPPTTGGGSTTSGSSTNTTGEATALTGLTIVAGAAGQLCVGPTQAGVAGSTLMLQTCDGSAGQRFFVESGQIKTADNLCVSTADGNQTAFGENIVLGTCGTPGSNWGMYKGMLYYTPNPNWVAIAPVNDALAANTILVLSHYNAADAAQHWSLNVTVPGANGGLSVSGFPIAATNDNTICLSAATGAITTGTCNGASIQTWMWNTDGGLQWGANNSLCLDANAANANVMTGAQAILNPCNNSATQWWLNFNSLILDGTNLGASGSLQTANYNWSWGRGSP